MFIRIIRNAAISILAAALIGSPILTGADSIPSGASKGAAQTTNPPPITGTLQLDQGTCPADPTRKPNAQTNKFLAPWLAWIFAKLVTNYIIDPLANKWEKDIESARGAYTANLDGITASPAVLYKAGSQGNDSRALGFQCIRFFSGSGGDAYTPAGGHFFLMANLVPVATTVTGGYQGVGPAMAYEVKPVYAKLNVSDATQAKVGASDFGIAINVLMSTGPAASDWHGTSRLKPFNLHAGGDPLIDPSGDANASNRLILPAFPSDEKMPLKVSVEVQVVEKANGWDAELLSAAEDAISCANKVADTLVANAAAGKTDNGTTNKACN